MSSAFFPPCPARPVRFGSDPPHLLDRPRSFSNAAIAVMSSSASIDLIPLLQD